MTQNTKEQLLQVIKHFKDKRVLVVGDIMLDEYVWGKVRRISPEAPVPIVNVEDRTFMAGGAANTGSNIASLDGQVDLIGVIGDDHQASLLKEKLLELNIESGGLIQDSKYPTITKTRIIANKQHLVRVDVEVRETMDPGIENRILDRLKKQIPKADVIVISDYGKKAISKKVARTVIEMGLQSGRKIIVDPKGIDYSKYKHATIITPNILEAELALRCEINDEQDVQKAGSELNQIIQGEAILLTRGSDGMTLFRQNREPITIPAVARALYDVTGAGDTVVGTLAMALAAGAELEEAVILANLAAGLVVEKLGTATVTCDELKLSLTELP